MICGRSTLPWPVSVANQQERMVERYLLMTDSVGTKWVNDV